MNSRRLVIAGARYYSAKNDVILIPHFTGEYADVDCDRYLTKDEVIEIYGLEEDSMNATIDFENVIHHKGVDYIYAESAVYEVTEKWELLSTLTNLRYEGDD